MKIITYNLWDSPAGMPDRKAHIQATLTVCDADVLCLQEVSDLDMAEAIGAACECPYRLYHPEAGCAVLSRLPLSSPWQHPNAVGAILTADSAVVRIVSLHLPWNSASARGTAITEIVQKTNETIGDYTILAGDFNASDTSDVHRYLTGDCSLEGFDANYFDLALSWEAITGHKPENTLDFQRNPRWRVWEAENTIEVPRRFDRIYLQNPYPARLPVLREFGIFGTEVYPETGLSPSDHYGVYAELSFPKSIKPEQKGSQA